jgi:hypothetical protein
VDLEDEDGGWALSAEGWGVLLSAAAVTVDEFGEEVEYLGSGRLTFEETSMAAVLPPLFLTRYDAGFAAAFLAATRSVATKLQEAREQGRPYPDEELPGCVAEELALDGILDRARDEIERRLDEDGLTPARRGQLLEEVEMLRDVAFADRDFEFLFDPSKDGAVEDPDLVAQMSSCNLGFAEWFSPFQ